MGTPPIPPGPRATISNIPALNTALQNSNWQILAGTQGGDPWAQTTLGSVVGNQRTSRINYIPTFNCSHIIVVYGNVAALAGDVAPGETPGANTLNYRCAAEYTTIGTESSETGVRMRGYFGGRREGEITPGQLLLSDPIEFNAQVGVPFFIRSGCSTRGSACVMPILTHTSGGTGAGGLNNGEGQANATDVVDVGTVTQQVGNTIAPIMVLGYSPTPQKTLGIIGDSIAAGNYDFTNGGWPLRVALAQTVQPGLQYPITPNFPHFRAAHTGEKLADWVTPNLSQFRTRLVMMASTVLCEDVTNDIFNALSSLATVQAYVIQVAVFSLQRGKRHIQSTCLPRNASTDGWLTVANQSTVTGETVRTGFNSWLRDPSASGFVQQASAAAGVYGNCFVFDAAAVVEVNSSNVLTLNGGLWICSNQSAVLTGTATAGTSGSTLNDTGQAMTQDQYKGASIHMTSGTFVNKNFTIVSNTPTSFALNGNGEAIVSGNTYAVYTQGNTIDGVHPTSYLDWKIAQAFPLSLVA